MNESTDKLTRSVLGLPAWIQARPLARFAFLLVGVFTCSFTCVFGIAYFHDGVRTWREHASGLLSLSLLGFSLGAFVPLMLMSTDVRRSVPFVWIATVASAALGLWLAERMHWDLALFLTPPLGGFIASLIARRLFRWE